jgi:two-component system sensor histidine kinase PilS (NtrC family)
MPRFLDMTPIAEDPGLYRRLVWLTVVRIILVTLLLGASTLVLLKSDTEEPSSVAQILFGIIIATYLASLAYLLILRSAARLHRRLAWAQMAGDVLIASCLVYLTGGTQSGVVFMFPLSVVSAAVLLYRKGALVAALLASASFALVALGLSAGWLPPLNARAVQAIPAAKLAFILSANVGAIFLTAALASYLAEQLRTVRERLSLREHDYRALAQIHESIVRSLASGIVTADRFGRLTYLNTAAERIFGVCAKEVLGTPAHEPLPLLRGRLAEVPGAARFEADHATGSGDKRRLGVAITPLLERDGSAQGHVVVVEDLTGIRTMEAAVRRSEQLAAVGTLAAGLAHELRNPLASMSGSIQLLGERKAFSEDERRLMRIVLREADRLNALVTDFLKFARPSPAQIEAIDLAEVVASTAALFRNDPTRKGIELKSEMEQELKVMGDAGQLGQVLWNLLTNAADAMPSGGAITIEGRCIDRAIELTVRDCGAGMGPDELPHLFEPFFTTKERGTGLGLAMVHGIVQAHRGEIAVESERGAGTIFTIRLPMRDGRQ